MSIGKRILIIFLSIIGGIFLVSFFTGFLVPFFQTSDSTVTTTSNYTGLTVTRDTFVKSCFSAVGPEEAGKFTDEQLSNYCGCTYDKGLALYGEEKLYQELSKLAETNNFTPEFNTIINECVQENLL